MKHMTTNNYLQLLQNSDNVLSFIEWWERTLDEDAILEQSVDEIKENLKELKTNLLEGFKE